MKLAALLVAACCAAAVAQTPMFNDPANLRGEEVSPHDGRELPVDQGARGLQQMLRRLNTRASLMLIIAHPDDEDGGMLTLYSRGLGARVAMLTLNRGEGGQNAMTGDFEDALGLLRTQELLASDRYLGVNQMFGTEVDFGFCKTKEEAFAKWTHERVLYDAVRAVRLYRPLVIASVFIGGVTDGHGQHQVSGEIAQEVFKAAADPKVFPDQIAKGLLPWAPLKVYARVPMQAITEKGLYDYATGQYAPARFTNYVTGEVTTTAPSADVVVHEGTPDPLLDGKSYVQFGRMGLGLQKSQIGSGMRVPPAGAFDISYHRYGSRLDAAHQKAHEDSFFDGIDTSIEGIASLASDAPGLRSDLSGIQASLQKVTQHFDPRQPANSADDLTDLLLKIGSTIRAVDSGSIKLDATEKANVLHELKVKAVQANDALVLAFGLKMDASTANPNVAAGSEIEVKTSLTQQTGNQLVAHQWIRNATPQNIKETYHSDQESLVTSAQPLTRTFHAGDAFTSRVTKPYFFRESIEHPVYQLSDPQLRLAPQSPPALVAWAELTQGVAIVRIGRIVHTDSQPVSFTPTLNVALSNHAQVLPNTQDAVSLAMEVTPSSAKVAKGGIAAPPGWHVEPHIADAFPTGRTNFHVYVPIGDRHTATLHASATLPNGTTYTEGYRPVGYGELPHTNYFTPAIDRIVPVDLKLPTHRRIAYLPGTGDAVPESLASIDLKPTMLTVADLTTDKLKAFDTVILGVRTYSAHPDLHGAPTQALLDFARSGGNVVVQYQTAEFTQADAPYPLTLSGSAEKVVDETADVKLLDTKAPLLTTPNHIDLADFNNWVEERGHGFLRDWDAHYTASTETHDPGQEPQRGGLITTQLGKGHWTYCAFALYRQLPEAIPGSYRLFVNL
ncbi:MAG TPA: PIG-L family deacetylase, partial [Granulicella sp.]